MKYEWLYGLYLRIFKPLDYIVFKLDSVGGKLLHQGILVERYYKRPYDLKEADAIIQKQDQIIGELTREVQLLRESDRRTQSWLENAKKQAGRSVYDSFDDVWREVLENSERYKVITNNL